MKRILTLLNAFFFRREAKAAAKPSLFIVWMVMLVSLFAVGCGSSNGDFVFTGNQGNQTPGTLTFNFVRAQSATEVPQSTFAIQFDWINNAGGIISTVVEPFAAQITLVPPAGAQRARITPLTEDGFPLFSIEGPVGAPPAGTNQVVDTANWGFTEITLDGITLTPDPVTISLGTQNPTQQMTVTGNFSNGTNVVFPASALADVVFTPDNSNTYTVNATGLVTGVMIGNGQLSASYTFTEDGATVAVSDTVAVNVSGGVLSSILVTPDPLEAGIGATTDPVTVTFSPVGGNATVIDNADVDFSIDGTGFTANADGSVTVAADVAPGTSSTLTASYTDANGTYTDTVTVTAVNAHRFIQPAGDSLTLPIGSFPFQLAVAFNGNPVEQLFANGYTITVANPDLATVNGAGVLTTTDVPGTTDVSLLFQGEVVDQFSLSTANVSVTSIVVDPREFQLTPGQVVPYSVMATYSDNTTADLAASPLVATSGLLDTQFYAGRAIGGRTVGNSTYSFEIFGATDNVSVTQAAGFVSSYSVTVGGLPSGNIPLGLQAAVDIQAVLTTGETYRLRPDQYALSETDDPNNAFEQEGPNLIGPENPSVGNSATFTVEIGSSFVMAPGVNSTTTFTVTAVDNTGGTATASFTNYSDDNVIFEDISRPITVLFSNAAVQNFRVTDEDATTRSNASTTNIRTDADIWGLPALRAWDWGFEGLLTIEVETGNNQVLAVTQMDVRVWDVDEDPKFSPSSILLNPGETRQVEVLVKAFDNQGVPVTFSRALDFAYPTFNQDSGVFARRGVHCAVTGIRPGTDTEISAYDVCTLDEYGSLRVTVLGAAPI